MNRRWNAHSHFSLELGLFKVLVQKCGYFIKSVKSSQFGNFKHFGRPVISD
jgi:hypothetical protein